MGIELAKAYVTVTADTMQASRALQGVEDDLGNLAGKAAVFGGVLTAAFGATARSAVMAAGKYEQTMIAFSTMMGSANKATNLLENLTKFAAETPFEMPEIEQVARGLVMFGESGDRMMETLTMLGNAASGTSSSFGMIGLVFNQIRGVGKLLTQDFRQLSTRGVVSLRDIAKYYKVTDAAAQEMISRGKVSFEDFRKIMLGLTGGSGRFANMMEKQSKSMIGLLSTFSDAWRITMRQIGQELVPIAKEVVAFGISFVAVFAEMDAATRKLVAGTVGLGAVFGGIGTALTGATFTVLKLHGAYVGMMSTLTSTAAMTQTVGAIAGVTSGTVQLTTAARNATIGLKAMAAAAWLTKAGLWGMALAASAVIGYNIGRWLYNMSAEAKNAKRVMDALMETVNGLPVVDWDKKLRGKGKAESKTYLTDQVKNIEKQIQQSKVRQKQFEEANGVWTDTSEKIAVEVALVERLEDNLAGARDKMVEFAEAGPDLDKQLKDAEDRLAFANREIMFTSKTLIDEQAVLARLEGATNLTQNEVAERTRLRENVKLHEERIEAMKEEKKNASSLAGSLKEKKNELEVDMKATEKIKEKTKALKIEADSYGMTAVQAEAYKMQMDKVADAEIKAYVAQKERTEAMKSASQAKLEAAKAEAAYADSLLESMKSPSEYAPDPLSGLFGIRPDMWADFDELGQILEEIKTPAENLDDVFARLRYNFDSGLLSSENYRKSLDQMGRSLTEQVMTPAEQMTKQISEWKQMFDNNAISQDTYNRLLKNMGRSLTEQVMTPAERTRAEIAQWTTMLNGGAISVDTYNRLLAKTKQGMDALSGTTGFADLHWQIQDMITQAGMGTSGLITAAQAAQAARNVKNEDLRFLPGPGGGMNAIQAQQAARNLGPNALAGLPQAPGRFDGIEILSGPAAEQVDQLIINNQKMDKLITAVKDQPKGGLL